MAHKYRAGSKGLDSRAAEKGARVIMDYRPRMTQEHNVFFRTANSLCGELNAVCQQK